MQTTHNVPLSLLTTMRLGGLAQQVVTCTSKEELEKVVTYAKTQQKPFFVIGGGSNIIARDEGYPGVIIINKIPGFKVIAETEKRVTVRLGAGENWDDTVRKLVEMGLSGVEAMSAIPGTVGATPVQNVGAYGQEIADTLVELEAFNTLLGVWTVIKKADCHFTYRNSIFKDPTQRHHIIATITLRLRKATMKPPFYDSLQRYLDTHQVTDYSAQNIRDAVVTIRAEKLPDPSKIANTGSFFKNPIVEREKASALLDEYPTMPHYPLHDGRVKLAAGWLIDHASLRGYAAHGFATYEHNALVVVNRTATRYADLAAFKQEIVDKVAGIFGVTLEQEPETL